MMALDRACIPAVVLIVEDEMVLRMRVVDMVDAVTDDAQATWERLLGNSRGKKRYG